MAFINLNDFSINSDHIKGIQKVDELNTRIFIELDENTSSILVERPIDAIRSMLKSKQELHNSDSSNIEKYISQIAKFQTVQVP